MTKHTVMEPTNMQMELYISVTGSRTNSMARASKLGPTEHDMTVHTKTEKKMDKAP